MVGFFPMKKSRMHENILFFKALPEFWLKILAFFLIEKCGYLKKFGSKWKIPH